MARKLKPETIIMRQIKEYLQWHGWYVIRFQQGLGSMPGITDLCAIRDGRTVWIEVKGLKGRLSPAQEEFARCIKFEKGEFFCFRSLDEAMRILP